MIRKTLLSLGFIATCFPGILMSFNLAGPVGMGLSGATAQTAQNAHEKLSMIDAQLDTIDSYVDFLQTMSLTDFKKIKPKTKEMVQAIKDLCVQVEEFEELMQNTKLFCGGSGIGFGLSSAYALLAGSGQLTTACALSAGITGGAYSGICMYEANRNLNRKTCIKTVLAKLLLKIPNKTVRSWVIASIPSYVLNPDFKDCLKELERELDTHKETVLKDFVKQHYDDIRTSVKDAKKLTETLMNTSLITLISCFGLFCYNIARS